MEDEDSEFSDGDESSEGWEISERRDNDKPILFEKVEKLPININCMLMACEFLIKSGIPKPVTRMIIMYTDPEYWASKAFKNGEYFWWKKFSKPPEMLEITHIAMAFNFLNIMSGMSTLKLPN